MADQGNHCLYMSMEVHWLSQGNGWSGKSLLVVFGWPMDLSAVNCAMQWEGHGVALRCACLPFPEISCDVESQFHIS